MFTMFLLPWKRAGTALGLSGALVLSLNLSISGYAFILLLFSSYCWTVVGFKTGDKYLFITQVGFVILSLIGIYNWLIVS